MPVLRLGHPAELRRKLNRLASLPAADRWCLLQAAWGLPINAAGVRVAGPRRWGALLARVARPGTPLPAGGLPVARQTGRLVQWAARYGPYSGNCLSRSLTLWWLLRRQGLSGDLRIGVTRAGGRFEAHAWVEYEGVVVNDRPDVRQRYGAFELPVNSAIPFS